MSSIAGLTYSATLLLSDPLQSKTLPLASGSDPYWAPGQEPARCTGPPHPADLPQAKPLPTCTSGKLKLGHGALIHERFPLPPRHSPYHPATVADNHCRATRRHYIGRSSREIAPTAGCLERHSEKRCRLQQRPPGNNSATEQIFVWRISTQS